jgi:outer membrane protein assembly factor BamB
VPSARSLHNAAMTRPAFRSLSALLAASLATACSSTEPQRAPATPTPAPPRNDSVLVMAGGPELQPGPPESARALSVPTGEFDVAAEVPTERQHRTEPVRTIQLKVRLTPRWSVWVGKTTFRTTMAMVGDTLVIGTHGASLNGKNEATDGVYVLAAATGKRRKFIATPGAGDRDVGGVAVDGRTVYFGTDNAQVIAASLDGKILWKARAQGKVRPAPALADLNGDAEVDVVIGDEEGNLYALEGKSGASLWTARTGANGYGARGFIAAAAITDLDGDGHDDVVAGARDGILTAYRGSDGTVLWQVPQDSGMHASPVIADFDHDGHPEVLAAWSYGNVGVYDGRTGRVRWSALLEQDDAGIEGLFGTPTPLSGKPGVLIAPTAWWDQGDGVIGVGVRQRQWRAYDGRITASAVVTDVDSDGTLEAILGSEKGNLFALRADGGIARLASRPGGIEATCLLADVDGNGSYELLVASNDGMLTCYETGSKSRPAVARFRGESAHNRGDLGQVSLGWHEAPGAPEPQATPGGGIRVDYLLCCGSLQEAAVRAPSPQNRQLLRAAGRCELLAAEAQPRGAALREIQTEAGDAPLPEACR